ncbi:hypothetical protein PC2016_2472 [Pseudoalteromonas carrageenovora]|uniref:Membrane protein triplicated sequence n=2 Tax=Pseudoalteromonas carrageenovora IAM 12662 TaxID=1314868 RepID=A0A2K4XBX4_PSEVC|nr:hypothetical protein [Pseudoalteromonas carrageenovora]QBJ72663.1 hypothetical protein PC2016_2472 [Pseudoalteromonas carrageenovora]SOU41784.1 conserved membrane protein of unknown function [Pseudoalteromonas carrageenovora IAM 12662]
MFLTELFGHFSLSAFIMWAFLMALFFNIFVYSLDIKRNTTLLLSSFVMFLSCALFDYFLDWFSIYDLTYFDFVVNNFMIILLLLGSRAIMKVTTPSYLYLLVGLTINIVLALGMQLDVFILGNTEPWFFWDLYTFSVFTLDLLMAVALIVDRDFLLLNRLKKKLAIALKSSISKPTI